MSGRDGTGRPVYHGSLMAFDINLPHTPREGSSVGPWVLWVVRAQASVALSLAADTASVVAGIARAAADALAGVDRSE